MPYSSRQQPSSPLVPIALIVLFVAMILSLASSQQSVQGLKKANKTVCEYLRKDASTRFQQAVNQRVAIKAQESYIAEIVQVVKVFQQGKRHGTKAQKNFTNLLISYLKSQANLTKVQKNQTIKNLHLSSQLALKARALASQLKC